jgi:hypothetical protein
MSYCRWSTDNFNCDLYVYEAEEGYVIHIAAVRYAGDIPKVDWGLLMADKREEFSAQMKAQHDFLDEAERVPIGLPFDGQALVADNLEQLEQFLFMLRETGYRFPDGVLEAVREEMEEEIET